MYRSILVTLLFLTVPVQQVLSQDANNAWNLSHQSVLFGDRQVSHDPVTLVMPGTAQASGFSSYLDNPASAAFFDRSFGSFGLVFRSVSEKTRFLDNTHDLQDNQTGISNLGFVYRFPTVRGSLVWGAGYSQHSFFNRAMSIGGRNMNSSITDFLKIPESEYNEVAFNTYAIDIGDEIGDWDESIFRIGFENFGDFLGIDQDAEILQRGAVGDYSTFLATEFLENLMVGASVALRSGRFVFDRTFLEEDGPNLYDGLIIDSNDDGIPDTDMRSILLTDRLRSEFLGLSLGAGAIYRIGRHLHLAASYSFPGRLSVDEELDGRIVSTFNNDDSFDDDLRTRFSYSVRMPGRVQLGAALVDFNSVTISLSGEYVDHGATRVRFESERFRLERDENQFISENYRAVWNLRGGLAVDLGEQLTLRGGYGMRPSRFASGGVNERQFSAGVGFSLFDQGRLELGAQYSLRSNERSVVYDYADFDYSVLPDETPRDHFSIARESALRDMNRLQVLATFQLFFN